MAINLKEVDGVPIKRKHIASCHCGSVQIELDLPNGLEDVRRCDCSLCRRRGAIAASVPLSGINILKGESDLNLYQFNTNTAKHYFCGKCGVYTHHQRRSNPEQYGFNVACLEGINPLTIEGVPTYDGVNHPADRK
ncbi:GFA family protein [Microbulbifer sp. ZKSA006]|uniref:GFA family protein n=1 Tax=Microbulbifer sp. ZKSA006 TaxID=3243390 RepID=UPI00403A0F74